MTARKNKARLWVKIVSPKGGQIGPGKIALLKAIRQAGSISAAARSLKMSYARAWRLIEETGSTIGTPVIETRIGGAGKGGATLSAAGEDLITLFDQLEVQANKVTSSKLTTFFRRWSPK